MSASHTPPSRELSPADRKAVERLLGRAVGGPVPGELPSGGESLQDRLSAQEWAQELQAWADAQDPATPVLSDAAMSREAFYGEIADSTADAV
ncbi:MAG: hypothetical protein GC160_22595 [Acidobacteria bacterium]|nr:hypothetical protein [Acidobacteriota bacterium]